MLTKEQALFDFENGQIKPDRLTSRTHREYVGLAEQMLRIYRDGAGKRRKELEQEVADLFDSVENCSPRRIKAFQKLLNEKCCFDRGKRWQTQRLKVYEIAAQRYPLRIGQSNSLFGTPVQEVQDSIAAKLKQPWEQIEEELFSDVKHFQRLLEFASYANGRELLSRYNVAQTQAALYSAVEMIVEVSSDYKAVLRQAKLAKLLHTIEEENSGYRITFDGPVSVVHESQRYGVAMAKFLPSLLACKNWKMQAKIRTAPRKYAFLKLSPNSGLRSPVQPDNEFDSSIEQKFAEKWGEKQRDGWTLHREEEILHRHQKVFIPDFVLRHESGKKVYLEIAGFWTEQYWKRKQETLEYFTQEPIILAIPKRMAEKAPMSRIPVILYGEVLKLQPVIQILNSQSDEEPKALKA